MRKSVLAWSFAAALVLLLAGLPALWVWARQRAATREKCEKEVIERLRFLANLQTTYREKEGIYWSGAVAPFLAEMHIRTASINVPMHPIWEEVYAADASGAARPTSYGYLFEALPAKGFLFRAPPAKDPRLRTFVVDETGEVIAK